MTMQEYSYDRFAHPVHPTVSLHRSDPTAGETEVDQLHGRDMQTGHANGLRRTFGVFQLTMISVGATLGTGILVILGEAVPVAGPAVWLAFVLAGVTALLSAVSYAEMAGMVPVSGSSYSYSYATLGEGVAWVCGWCLVLEYAVSVAAVAVGAADY